MSKAWPRTTAILFGRKCTRAHIQTKGQRSTELQAAPSPGPPPPTKAQQAPQPNLFSWVGGWCRLPCKPSAGNLSRIHDLFVKHSSSLFSFSTVALTKPEELWWWPHLKVPKISQTRATAQECHDVLLFPHEASAGNLSHKPE